MNVSCMPQPTLTSGTLLFDVSENSNGDWEAGTYSQPWGGGSLSQEIQDVRCERRLARSYT